LLDHSVEELTSGAGSSAIESKGKFIEVIVQVRTTNRSLMGSQQPSFQQRSCPMSQGQQVFSGFGGFSYHSMNVSQGSQLTITCPIISANQAARLHGFLDRLRETLCRSIGHPHQPNSPNMPFVFLGCDHHQSLSRRAAATLTRLFTADIGFINLNDTRQTVTAWSNPGYSQLLKPDPYSFITWQPKDFLKSQRADAGFLAGHMPDGPKPQTQRFSGVLENGACGDRDLIIAMTTAIKASLGSPGFTIATPWTRKPFWPPQLKQIPAAGLFGSKPLLELQNGAGIIFNFHHPSYYI